MGARGRVGGRGCCCLLVGGGGWLGLCTLDTNKQKQQTAKKRRHRHRSNRHTRVNFTRVPRYLYLLELATPPVQHQPALTTSSMRARLPPPWRSLLSTVDALVAQQRQHVQQAAAAAAAAAQQWWCQPQHLGRLAAALDAALPDAAAAPARCRRHPSQPPRCPQHASSSSVGVCTPSSSSSSCCHHKQHNPWLRCLHTGTRAFAAAAAASPMSSAAGGGGQKQPAGAEPAGGSTSPAAAAAQGFVRGGFTPDMFPLERIR
jgi:hypothetical protein